MDSPQLQFFVVAYISVIAHGQIPMVLEFLQLQYIDKVVDVGCAGVVAMPVVCIDRCRGGRRCDPAATRSSCRPQQLE